MAGPSTKATPDGGRDARRPPTPARRDRSQSSLSASGPSAVTSLRGVPPPLPFVLARGEQALVAGYLSVIQPSSQMITFSGSEMYRVVLVRPELPALSRAASSRSGVRSGRRSGARRPRGCGGSRRPRPRSSYPISSSLTPIDAKCSARTRSALSARWMYLARRELTNERPADLGTTSPTCAPRSPRSPGRTGRRASRGPPARSTPGVLRGDEEALRVRRFRRSASSSHQRARLLPWGRSRPPWLASDAHRMGRLQGTS